MASIAYSQHQLPSMQSAFVMSSTIASWLASSESSIAIIIAPDNQQLSVYATCCAIYCMPQRKIPANVGTEIFEM